MFMMPLDFSHCLVFFQLPFTPDQNHFEVVLEVNTGSQQLEMHFLPHTEI